MQAQPKPEYPEDRRTKCRNRIKLRQAEADDLPNDESDRQQHYAGEARHEIIMDMRHKQKSEHAPGPTISPRDERLSRWQLYLSSPSIPGSISWTWQGLVPLKRAS